MKGFALDLSELILGASSILYFFVGIILWRRAANYFLVANRLLSLFYWFIAYNSFTYWLISTQYIIHLPFLYKVAFPLNYLPYPISYLYIRAIVKNQLELTKKDVIHFLPFLLTLIEYIPFYLLPYEEKRQIVNNFINNSSESFFADKSLIPMVYHFMARFILGAYYCIKILVLIHKINTNRIIHFSEHRQHVKDWLKSLASLLILLYFFYNATVINNSWGITKQFNLIITSISLIGTTISILLIPIYLFKYPSVLYGIPEIVNTPTLDKNINDFESSKSLTPRLTIEKELYWEKLNKKLKEDALFKNSNVSIKEVAKFYDISPRALSFLINHFTNDNFQTYLNSLRIEYVLNLFQQKEHHIKTIESIGKDAGFGSKSAFFSCFKKYTGQTPKEYIIINNLEIL